MAAPKAPANKASKSSAKKGGSKLITTIKKLMTGGKSAPAKTAPAAKAMPTKSVGAKAASASKTPAKKIETKPAKVAVSAAPAKKGAAVPAAPAKATKVAAAPVPAVPVKKPLTKAPRARKGEPLDPMARVMATRAALEASGEIVCREVACEGLMTTGGYCRLHYIKNWKKIKRKEVILRERKLNQYIEELVAKYPDKYIDAIRQDLASDQDFAKVIYDLDLDEGADDFDAEGEGMEGVIDSIKRDFDDDAGDF